MADIEPGRYPNVLNSQSQPENQFYRHCQQHADCEELESRVLQQAGSSQKLLFKRVLRKPAKRPQRQLLEMHRHEPVEEQGTQNIEPADDQQTEDKLERIG